MLPAWLLGSQGRQSEGAPLREMPHSSSSQTTEGTSELRPGALPARLEHAVVTPVSNTSVDAAAQFDP